MEVAFTIHAKATHYAIDEKNGLVLYWTDRTDRDGIQALPYPINCEQAKSFVWGWLELQWEKPSETMEAEPDHDGNNSKGFHIHTGDFWGHVDNHWEAWLAIKPEWILIGK